MVAGHSGIGSPGGVGGDAWGYALKLSESCPLCTLLTDQNPSRENRLPFERCHRFRSAVRCDGLGLLWLPEDINREQEPGRCCHVGGCYSRGKAYSVTTLFLPRRLANSPGPGCQHPAQQRPFTFSILADPLRPSCVCYDSVDDPTLVYLPSVQVGQLPRRPPRLSAPHTQRRLLAYHGHQEFRMDFPAV